jgi:hypothetical protein
MAHDVDPVQRLVERRSIADIPPHALVGAVRRRQVRIELDDLMPGAAQLRRHRRPDETRRPREQNAHPSIVAKDGPRENP